MQYHFRIVFFVGLCQEETALLGPAIVHWQRGQAEQVPRRMEVRAEAGDWQAAVERGQKSRARRPPRGTLALVRENNPRFGFGGECTMPSLFSLPGIPFSFLLVSLPYSSKRSFLASSRALLTLSPSLHFGSFGATGRSLARPKSNDPPSAPRKLATPATCIRIQNLTTVIRFI